MKAIVPAQYAGIIICVENCPRGTKPDLVDVNVVYRSSIFVLFWGKAAQLSECAEKSFG